MKAPLIGFSWLVATSMGILAQAPSAPSPPLIASTAISVRDGFTRSGASVIFTFNGVAYPVDKEFEMPSGLRVRPDGTITLPNGDTTALDNNQILNFDGSIENVALTQKGQAPVTTFRGR